MVGIEVNGGRLYNPIFEISSIVSRLVLAAQYSVVVLSTLAGGAFLTAVDDTGEPSRVGGKTAWRHSVLLRPLLSRYDLARLCHVLFPQRVLLLYVFFILPYLGTTFLSRVRGGVGCHFCDLLTLMVGGDI